MKCQKSITHSLQEKGGRKREKIGVCFFYSDVTLGDEIEVGGQKEDEMSRYNEGVTLLFFANRYFLLMGKVPMLCNNNISENQPLKKKGNLKGEMRRGQSRKGSYN